MESPYATTWYVWVALGLVIFHEVFWVMVFAFALPLSTMASDAMTPKAEAWSFVMGGPPEKGAYPRLGFPEMPPCSASRASRTFTVRGGTPPGRAAAARAGPPVPNSPGAGS